LRLARVRAERILASGEDPLLSVSYFYRLMVDGDYPEELHSLGYLDDYDDTMGTGKEDLRRDALEYLQELLHPELGESLQNQRRLRWEQAQIEARREWPYVLNSRSGRALLKARYLERISELRNVFLSALILWMISGLAFKSWGLVIFGAVVYIPSLLILPLPHEYIKLRRERRDTLWRMGVPDDQI